MYSLNKKSVVAILDEKEDKQEVLVDIKNRKKPIGTGFFISNELVITCAHVISDATTPPEDVLYIRTIDGDVIEVKIEVDFWRASKKEDIAILRLVDSPLEKIESLSFSCSEDIRGHAFETYGFPEGHPSGLAGIGSVVSLNPGPPPLLQLKSDEIVVGFSGGPIFDQTTGRVVGMTTEKVTPDMKNIDGSVIKKSTSQPIMTGMREVAKATPSFVIRDVCQDCKDINFQEVCPYQGLDAFTEERADYFFGRDKLVEKLIKSLEKSPRFLSVTGTSGSGKSSIIRAKLLPYLRKNGVFVTDRISSVVTIRLSDNQSLEESFLHSVSKQLNVQSDNGNPINWDFLENFGSSDLRCRLIIFIDQFEEIFTLHTPSSADILLTRLNQLLKSNSSITLILASRIEFEPMLEASPFNYRLGEGSFQVRGIPGADLELDKIIVKPAEFVGLAVEEGLVDRMIQDLGTTNNPLPLLEFALKKLWDIDIFKAGKSSLTLGTYKTQLIRISKVLSDTAKDFYEYRLSNYSTKEWKKGDERNEDEKKLIRSILGRLIKFNSQLGTNELPDTRRSVRRAKLEEITNEAETNNIYASDLLNQMIGVGLLAVDKDNSNIEIIHDILVKEWIGGLTADGKNWLDGQREFRLWQQRLEEDISSWQSKKCAEDFLLSGSQLTIAEDFFSSQKGELATIECNYILESLERRDVQKEIIEQENRKKLEQQAELETERKEKFILANAYKKARIIFFVTIIASTFISLFAYQRDQFSQKASHAEQVSREALKKFPLGQLDALGSAIDAAKELQEITKDIKDIKDYPTIGPITVLREILDKIQESRHFNGNQGEIRGAIFLPEGDRFITAGAGTEKGGTLKMWSISGDSVGELEGHEVGVISGGVKGIAIGGTNQSPLIASAGGDGTARIWDKGKKLVRSLEVAGQKERKPFTSIAVSKDGQRVVAGQSNGMIHVWERSGKLLKSWTAHSQDVTGVAFSGDGQKIATSSEDGLARVWTLTGNRTAELKSPNVKKVMGVSFSIDGKLIATASDDQVARIWSVDGKEVKRMEGHEGLLTVANFSPDGKTVATASDDGTVKLWDAKTGQKLQDFRGHRGVVWTASFSQDGQHLVSTGRDGEIRLWNLGYDSSKVTELPGFKDDVNAIVFSPPDRDGKPTIVGAGNEGVMRQWDSSGKELKVWEEAIFQKKNVQDLAFSPEGKLLLASGLTNIARIWKIDEQNTNEPFIRLKGGEDTEKAHQGDILSIAVSPNGQFIATGSSDETIRIWKMETTYGKLVKVISMPKDAEQKDTEQKNTELKPVVSRVVFTPDSQKIISADWTGNVIIWNLEGKAIKQFKKASTQIRGLGVTRGGDKIVTADKMGNIRIIDISGNILKEFKSYQSGINELTISSNGQLIATAGMDKTARIWDFQGRQVAEFLNPKGAVWGVSFSPDSRSIAFSGDKGFAVVRSIDTLDQLIQKSCNWLKESSKIPDCR
jgi:WD40 repeat protein